MLSIKKFIVNPLQENSYVVSDETGDCIFIDPGFYFPEEQDKVKKYISDHDLYLCVYWILVFLSDLNSNYLFYWFVNRDLLLKI